MTSGRLTLIFILMASMALAEGPRVMPGGYKIVDVTDPGTVRGRVVFAGEVPEMSPLIVTADRAGCGDLMKPDESLILGPNQGVANCVASLDGIREGKAPAVQSPSVLGQRLCLFTPHVMTAQAGAKLIVTNSDPIAHNVHAYSMPGMYTRFNVGQPIRGAESHVQLGRPELLVLRCDAGHRWMNGYIFVAPNPYHAVSAADGTFSIDGVPAGKHKLRVWHEWAGEATLEVTVPPAGTVEVQVVAQIKPKPGVSIAPGAASTAAVGATTATSINGH